MAHYMFVLFCSCGQLASLSEAGFVPGVALALADDAVSVFYRAPQQCRTLGVFLLPPLLVRSGTPSPVGGMHDACDEFSAQTLVFRCGPCGPLAWVTWSPRMSSNSPKQPGGMIIR